MLRKILLAASLFALSACNASRPVIYAGGSQALVNKTISVARGSTAFLNFVTALNPDCTHMDERERVVLTQAPSQGHFETSQTTGFAYFPPFNPRSRCNSQRVAGTKAFYHANSNAAGTDAFSYDWFTVTGGVVHYNVTVNIM